MGIAVHETEQVGHWSDLCAACRRHNAHSRARTERKVDEQGPTTAWSVPGTPAQETQLSLVEQHCIRPG